MEIGESLREVQLHTCHFCGGYWMIMESESGDQVVMHVEPACQQFILAKDALAWMQLLNQNSELN